ncbi:hypothetical protein G7046_g8535 [Stylonectria norvegica]|nr:hypothetical protein G7046_g8535 [Stylonectria norvegica]
MRPTSTLLPLAMCLSSLAPLAAAWPGWLPDVDALVVRADDTTTAKPKATATTEESAKSTDDSNATTTDEKKSQKTDTASDDKKKTTSTKKGSAKTTKKSSGPTHTSYDNLLPAGGVSMSLPNTVLQATPLYKINDFITFAWNYTSLQGTPTAIDVLVSCSVASETWTLTSNMTYETNPSFIWNTKDDGNNPDSPLLTELYTLIIKDSDTAITDIPDSGYLAPYTGLKFGLYKPQLYTPLPEWSCAGCNAAPASLDPHAVGIALTVSIVTVASFTWFVTGLGLH